LGGAKKSNHEFLEVSLNISLRLIRLTIKKENIRNYLPVFSSGKQWQWHFLHGISSPASSGCKTLIGTVAFAGTVTYCKSTILALQFFCCFF
jgi:hypothetical protein